MKKVLFLIVTVLFFSCDNDDLASKIDESNDLYVFREIEYLLEESDTLAIIALPEDSIAVGSLYDTLCFCFYPETYLPYILKPNESLLIPIPEGVEEGRIKLSSEAWKYSEEKVIRLIPASNRRKEELTVTYIATFTGMVTGNVVKLKGKWKSEYTRTMNP